MQAVEIYRTPGAQGAEHFVFFRPFLGHKGHDYIVVVPLVVPQISPCISMTYNLGAQEAQLIDKYIIKRGIYLYGGLGKDVPLVPQFVVSHCGVWAYLWGTTPNRRAPSCAPFCHKSLKYRGLSLGHNYLGDVPLKFNLMKQTQCINIKETVK